MVGLWLGYGGSLMALWWGNAEIIMQLYMLYLLVSAVFAVGLHFSLLF